jgi:hypothetical protein
MLPVFIFGAVIGAGTLAIAILGIKAALGHFDPDADLDDELAYWDDDTKTLKVNR